MSDSARKNTDEPAREKTLREARTPREGAWLASRSLLLFSVLAVGLLALIHHAAAPSIAKAEAEQKLRLLQQILPPDRYDNNLLTDIVEVDFPESFSSDEADIIWRARRGERVIATIIPATSHEGYSGDIHMLIGVYRDGTVAGVRITNHRETPGLGDGIEIARSNWIRQFDGKSLNNPTAEYWAVRKDGGTFDQLTGATITPRAVTQAIRQVLQFHADNHNRLYQATALPPSEVTP